jgi:NAD(P)-dependent dehydrogenase (short-subunit alcohol dehydrogenase family)
LPPGCTSEDSAQAQSPAVNLKGAFRLSALIGTRMAEKGDGVIIYMSSVGPIPPSPHELAYAAAKAGLNTFAGGL